MADRQLLRKHWFIPFALTDCVCVHEREREEGLKEKCIIYAEMKLLLWETGQVLHLGMGRFGGFGKSKNSKPRRFVCL